MIHRLGRYEPATSTLNWANAGHPPGMLMRKDGGIERFGPTGPLLGALADVVYDEECTRVYDGDSMLVYTDGVTEARHGNEFFGEERVAEVEHHRERALHRRVVRDERFAATAIALQLCFYVGAYLTTPFDVDWHVATSWAPD